MRMVAFFAVLAAMDFAESLRVISGREAIDIPETLPIIFIIGFLLCLVQDVKELFD